MMIALASAADLNLMVQIIAETGSGIPAYGEKKLRSKTDDLPTKAGSSKSANSEADTNLMSYRVSEALRSEILEGRMAPGSRIRQEELAKKYGVSRIPVREALHLLESDGLIILKPNSGAWVASINLAEFVETYKIRERVEPLALAESIPNLTEDQVDEIVTLRERVDSASSVEEFLLLDREFHLLTYTGAEMPKLLEMINRFWNSTQHYRRIFTEHVGSEGRWIINAEHGLLTVAIKRRDVAGASTILAEHIRRTRKALEAREVPSDSS